MNEPRQLDILKRLTAHIATISPASGWDFDLTTSVFRGRRVYGDNDPVPMVSIVEHLQGDGDIATAGDFGHVSHENWLLLVQGWIKATSDHPTDDAYKLKAQVMSKLNEINRLSPSNGEPMYPAAYLLGRTIESLRIGPGIVSGPMPEFSPVLAFFYLPLTVGLVVDNDDLFLP